MQSRVTHEFLYFHLLHNAFATQSDFFRMSVVCANFSFRNGTNLTHFGLTAKSSGAVAAAYDDTISASVGQWVARLLR